MLKPIPAFPCVLLITLTSGCDLDVDRETDRSSGEASDVAEFGDADTRFADRELQSLGSLTIGGRTYVVRGRDVDGIPTEKTKFDADDRTCGGGFFRQCSTHNIMLDQENHPGPYWNPEVKFYPADGDLFGKGGLVVCGRSWSVIGREVNAGCKLVVKTDEPYSPDDPDLGFRSKTVSLNTVFKGKVVGSGSSAELSGRLEAR